MTRTGSAALPGPEVLLGDFGEELEQRGGCWRVVHASQCRGGDGAHRGGGAEVVDGDIGAQVGQRELGHDGDPRAGGNHALDDVEVVAARCDA